MARNKSDLEKADNARYMNVSTARAALLQEVTKRIDKLSKAGFYTKFLYDDLDILEGADPKIGAVVADLSRDKGQQVILRAPKGSWSMLQLLAALKVALGEKEEIGVKPKAGD